MAVLRLHGGLAAAEKGIARVVVARSLVVMVTARDCALAVNLALRAMSG